MNSLLGLVLIIWAMFYTATRFLQYFRIVKEYKDRTTAKVIRVTTHERKSKREKKAVDVILEYVINGKEGRSEVVVPVEYSDQYPLGKEVSICYSVSGNGAVHIASDTTATKKLMYGYAAAIAVEFIAFVVIWWMML